MALFARGGDSSSAERNERIEERRKEGLIRLYDMEARRAKEDPMSLYNLEKARCSERRKYQKD